MERNSDDHESGKAGAAKLMRMSPTAKPEPVKAWAVVRGNGRISEASIYKVSAQMEVRENNYHAGNRGEPQDYRVIPVTITPDGE